ncbi:MAG: hypothetical protein Q7S29_05000 [Candidatus Peribacter sp.]|nr:hypothetical protein [Candidatus Peribacter sp.]
MGRLRAFFLRCTLLLSGIFLSLAVPFVARATDYYVDATGGIDANAGTSQAAPWQTLAKVNASSFQPGDQILLKKGEVWREKLLIPSSGAADNRIVFGAYGSGVNPKINGSALVSNAGFSPYAVSGAAVYSATTTTVGAADGGARNYRQIATVNADSSTVTIRLTAADTRDWVIAGCAIGLRTSGASASSLTRITFGGGNNGVTITAGGYVDSDQISFSVVSGQTYLIHVYMTERSYKQQASGAEGFYYDALAADETLVAAPTGSQLISLSSGTSFVTAIYGGNKTIWASTTLPSHAVSSLTSASTTATVTTPSAHHLFAGQYVTMKGATPTGYNITAQVASTPSPTQFTYTVPAGLASPATGDISYELSHPVAMWENNVFLLKQSSTGAVASGAGKWYFDTATRTLYVNGWDQNNPATNGKTYEVAHLVYSIYDNGKSYVEIKDINCLQSYGSADADGALTGVYMSGIFLGGSNNVVHDLETYNHARHNFFFYTGSTNNLGYNLTIRDAIGTTPFGTFSGANNNVLRNSTIYNACSACTDAGLIVMHGGAHDNIVEKNYLYVSVGVPSYFIIQYDADTDRNVYRFNRIRLLSSGGTAGIRLTTSDDTEIYGNLFEMSPSTSAVINIQSGTGAKVYNNTIIANSTLSASNYQLYVASSPNVVVKNNIFNGAYAMKLDAASQSGFVSDYNGFYNASGVKWTWGASDYTSFGDWKSNSVQDSHSFNADPLFTDAASDYTLQSASPARDAGGDLGSSYANGLDPVSTWPSDVRLLDQGLHGSAWEIGAYVYSDLRPTPGAGGAANYWRRLYENGLAPPDFVEWWEGGSQTSSSSSASSVSASSATNGPSSAITPVSVPSPLSFAAPLSPAVSASLPSISTLPPSFQRVLERLQERINRRLRDHPELKTFFDRVLERAMARLERAAAHGQTR